jgi:predicted small lipoprotein YifL
MSRWMFLCLSLLTLRALAACQSGPPVAPPASLHPRSALQDRWEERDLRFGTGATQMLDY